MDKPLIAIEVVYAEPEQQALVALLVPADCSAGDAVALAQMTTRVPGVDFEECPLGVWGHAVSREHVLREGDRVEIYRPLRRDPREARRQLAAHGQVMGGKPDPKYPG